MLSVLISLALRFRGVIYALSVIACGYGLYSISLAKLDVFPEFAPPMTVVQTQAPGLSSEQVETLVTQPIEIALGGTLGLKSMRSKSFQGLSAVTVVFGDGSNLLQARQLVTERLNTLSATLPVGVQPPALLPLTTTTSVVLTAGITSKTRSLMDLHDLAEWTIKPQLLNVPGVADVIIFGGETRQLQIQVDPAKLMRYDVTIDDVISAARSSTGVRGSGFIENGNQRIMINTNGQMGTPEVLAETLLNWKTGVGLRIGDVASVTYAPEFPVGAASIMGIPGVIFVIESQYGADTLAVTKGLERTFRALGPELAKQDIDLEPGIFRAANFILTATTHLRTALLIGAALVLAILFLFLLNVRTAFISAVAIPLSLLLAIIAMNAAGITMNTMTLGGLAIALGEVVDDAIIDVENIFRRLRENIQLPKPLPRTQVVWQASMEVRGSVVFATFIVILVFVPVLSLSGVAGKLFAPLGIAYILAVLASLIVALTLTPALALGLLGDRSVATQEPRFQTWLKSHYSTLLLKVERHARLVMGLAAILGIITIAILPFLHSNFIPKLREGHYIVHIGLAPGSSLTESMRIGTQISKALMKVPGVQLVAQRAGRADEVVDPVGVQLSEIDVALQPGSAANQDATLQKIQTVLGGFPGITTSINTFLVERIDETISGVTAPIAIEVFGDNLDIIDQKARQIAQLVSSIPGATSVRIASPSGTPELSVRLKPNELSRLGYRATDVLDAIQTAYQGKIAAQVYDRNSTTDIKVILAPESRARIDQIGQLSIRSLDGKLMPLHMLAKIEQVSGRYQITHNGGRRMQSVLVNVGGRTVSEFASEAQSRVNRDIVMPKGSYVIFAGEGTALNQSQRDLLVYGTIALVAITILLYLALRSSRSVLLVMANLPFALVGGIISVAFLGGELSLGGMVGFVTLFGISLRNSIMLISHYKHLVEVDRLPWGIEIAVRGASERLVPIMMTALVTAIGLLPLAITSGEAGNEIEGPMAVVILGGLGGVLN